MIKQIEINDKHVLQKRYKLRRLAHRSLETTIPFEVFEREAKRAGLTTDEAMNELEAVWRYNGLHGLYLSFEPKRGC